MRGGTSDAVPRRIGWRSHPVGVRLKSEKLSSMKSPGISLNSRAQWRIVAGFLVAATFGANLQRAVAQTPPRITRSEVSGGSLTLAWEGNSQWYEVQSARHLTTLDWHAVFRTSDTSVGLLLSGSSR